jgi:hypothetical protein
MGNLVTQLCPVCMNNAERNWMLNSVLLLLDSTIQCAKCRHFIPNVKAKKTCIVL